MTDRKRAVALAAGGVGLVVLYRMRRGAGASTTAGQIVNSSGSVAPYVPQSPITVGAGESVYDPNSGSLLTPTLDAQAPTPQATMPGAPSYTINVNYPKTVATRIARRKPTKRKQTRPKAVRKVVRRRGQRR